DDVAKRGLSAVLAPFRLPRQALFRLPRQALFRLPRQALFHLSASPRPPIAGGPRVRGRRLLLGRRAGGLLGRGGSGDILGGKLLEELLPLGIVGELADEIGVVGRGRRLRRDLPGRRHGRGAGDRRARRRDGRRRLGPPR